MQLSNRRSALKSKWLRAGIAGLVSLTTLTVIGGGGFTASATALSTIKLMVISDLSGPPGLPVFPYDQAVAIEWSKWINATGGLKGHKVQLFTCDSQNDPNASLQCARKAVADKVLAVVGSELVYDSASVEPILNAAHIAYLPTAAEPGSDFTLPNSFPIMAEVQQEIGFGYIAAKVCHSVVFSMVDIPQTPQLFGLIKAGAGAAGANFNLVDFPPTTVDFSTTAAQIMSHHPDCLISLYGGTQMAAIYPALTQAGATNKTLKIIEAPLAAIGPQATIDPTVSNNQILVGNLVPNTSPLWKQYNTVMKKYQGSTPISYWQNNWFGENTWVAYLIFTGIFNSMPAKQAITPGNFLKAAQHTTNASSGGLMPALNFTKKFPVAGFANLFDPYMTFAVMPASNGSTVYLPGYTGFKNLTAQITSALQG